MLAAVQLALLLIQQHTKDWTPCVPEDCVTLFCNEKTTPTKRVKMQLLHNNTTENVCAADAVGLFQCIQRHALQELQINVKAGGTSAANENCSDTNVKTEEWGSSEDKTTLPRGETLFPSAKMTAAFKHSSPQGPRCSSQPPTRSVWLPRPSRVCLTSLWIFAPQT